MPKPPPPFRPLAVSIAVERMRIVLPVAALVVIVLGASGLGVGALLREPVMLEQLPESNPQHYTVHAGHGMGALATLSLGQLPPPDPRQKKKPCDPDVGEEEIGGACWIRLPVEKCNTKKAYLINGKCYWRSLPPAPLKREPTSGETRHNGVADPLEE